MIIIHKPTESIMNEVEFREFTGSPDSPYRHILFDISHEGFEGSDFAIVEMPTQPVFDSRYQTAVPVNVTEVDGVYSGEWDLQVIDFGDDRQKRANLLADKRFEVETGGIDIAGNFIPTDRHTQQVLTSMYIKAMEDPNYTKRFKTSAGFVGLTAEQIIQIANAVHDHVQAAFDREDELLALIDAGDPITPLDW